MLLLRIIKQSMNPVTTKDESINFLVISLGSILKIANQHFADDKF